MNAKDVTIHVGETTGDVSGLVLKPRGAKAMFVLAHGAGAGMHHAFMERIAQELADRKVATLRYQFPYMEAGRKSPDVPNRSVATVRAAVGYALKHYPALTTFAGGKSFGGRMTSTAAARGEIDVAGIVFLGFPLHAPNKPSNKPSNDRAEHLYDVKTPMLFLQGTRDALARLELLEPVCKKLGKRSTLHIVDGGDHSFKVPKRSGRTEDEVFADLADTIAEFVAKHG